MILLGRLIRYKNLNEFFRLVSMTNTGNRFTRIFIESIMILLACYPHYNRKYLDKFSRLVSDFHITLSFISLYSLIALL